MLLGAINQIYFILFYFILCYFIYLFTYLYTEICIDYNCYYELSDLHGQILFFMYWNLFFLTSSYLQSFVIPVSIAVKEY